MTVEEIQAQAGAMINYFNQALNDANARIVNLVGEKALVEWKLAQALKPAEPPPCEPIPPPESN